MYWYVSTGTGLSTGIVDRHSSLSFQCTYEKTRHRMQWLSQETMQGGLENTAHGAWLSWGRREVFWNNWCLEEGLKNGGVLLGAGESAGWDEIIPKSMSSSQTTRNTLWTKFYPEQVGFIIHCNEEGCTPWETMRCLGKRC